MIAYANRYDWSWKMGLNLVKNIIRNGNEVVAFDLNPDNVKLAQEAGQPRLQVMKILLTS